MDNLRYAARMLRKTPGFTFAAVLALALGIGANTAIFSVVHGVLLRPLSYWEPERLVRLFESNIKSGFLTFSVAPGTFLDWQAQNHVALLSRSYWQNWFGGDPSIVGKQVTLNGQSRTIVGVVGPMTETHFLVPPSLSDDERQNQGSHYLGAIGRLKPGVSLEQAQADMDVIASNVERQHPEAKEGWTVRLRPVLETIVGDIRPALMLLMCAVGFVLLIVCANVANLLLACAAARQKEFAIRSALGAGHE